MNKTRDDRRGDTTIRRRLAVTEFELTEARAARQAAQKTGDHDGYIKANAVVERLSAKASRLRRARRPYV